MSLVSNDLFFPFLQILLVLVTGWAAFIDVRSAGRGSSMVVTRADESMKTLNKTIGVAVAVIVTIVNKSVFDANKEWANYSAFFNTVDLLAILYLFYLSSWGRNKIIGFHIGATTERR
ncbi:MAG TPA: hypothetical protein VN655_17515 [Pseudolabrys sp.]|jgi:hypothetical protein|nr:hypothetical protein [Pseudolabrys sp.]